MLLFFFLSFFLVLLVVVFVFLLLLASWHTIAPSAKTKKRKHGYFLHKIGMAGFESL